MNWTVIPVSRPLFVVATSVPASSTNTTSDKFVDILDALECVNFDPEEVYGLILDPDAPSPEPIGYLCGTRSFMAYEWAPFFTASTPHCCGRHGASMGQRAHRLD